MNKKDKKNENLPITENLENPPLDNQTQEEKKDVSQKIYNTLDKAEKIAIKLARLNQSLRKKDIKKQKKRKKKLKKLGKVDKKSGIFIPKKEKKIKKAKALKRYKAPNKERV